MDRQMRQDYDDVYRAMGNDSSARKRLEARGLLATDARLVDLYDLGSTLAEKLTASGDKYVEISANRAEKELGRLTSMFTCSRCGHQWWPRNTERPRICPTCKSPYWDKPKQPRKGKEE
jgi:predicted Zn-ribbon and HTH transcriptional regulator